MYGAVLAPYVRRTCFDLMRLNSCSAICSHITLLLSHGCYFFPNPTLTELRERSRHKSNSVVRNWDISGPVRVSRLFLSAFSSRVEKSREGKISLTARGNNPTKKSLLKLFFWPQSNNGFFSLSLGVVGGRKGDNFTFPSFSSLSPYPNEANGHEL